jgi:phosphoribosylaminoimidazolecarboxamide formyltransferase/IMP cyclohydrolase
MIGNFLSEGEKFEDFSWGGQFIQKLRYGENPHQEAIWLRERGSKTGLHQAEIIQGKALSFNNLLDLEAAVSTAREFHEITAVGVKHNNPCGVASTTDPTEGLSGAIRKMVKSDPVSIFGGIVACTSEIDKPAAEELHKVFLECVIAPSISKEALQVFQTKKNLRVLVWPQMMDQTTDWDLRSVSGGFLIQSPDRITEWQPSWKTIGENPNEKIRKDLLFAWRICAHLKSNAIALASGLQTLGLGMGQVNRVDAVKHALERMKSHHPGAENIVLASDAFFPFPDSIEVAAKNGVQWVIQPGGSVKDPEVEACAKHLKVNMILTGERHFRH